MLDPRNPRVTLIAVAGTLAVLAVGAWFIFDSAIAELYWLEIAGPPIERQFGFRMEWVETSLPGLESTYVITGVTSNGAFERAGVQPGDTLPGWVYHGPRAGDLYEALSNPSKDSLTLRVVNVRYGALWPRHVREVTIVRPGGAV